MKTLITKKNLLNMALVSFLAGGSVIALASSDCKEERREHRMERMLKNLDLSDAQRQKIDALLDSLEDEQKEHKGQPKMREMRMIMQLNPDDPNYLEQVEKHAKGASEQMQAQIIHKAKTRQQIHAILDEEQKQTLKQRMEKKMKRMEKRYEHEEHDD